VQNARRTCLLEPQGLDGHRPESAHIPELARDENSQGTKKRDLSKFVEEAVNRRLLQFTVQSIWERKAQADPDEVQRIVDEAVFEVRAERRAQ